MPGPRLSDESVCRVPVGAMNDDLRALALDFGTHVRGCRLWDDDGARLSQDAARVCRRIPCATLKTADCLHGGGVQGEKMSRGAGNVIAARASQPSTELTS